MWPRTWAEVVAWAILYEEPAERIGLAVLVGAGAWLTTYVVARFGLRLAARIAGRTKTTLDDELLSRLQSPVGLLGPVVGVHVVGFMLGEHRIVGAMQIVEGLLATYGVVAAFEILVLESWLEKRQGITVPPLVRQVLIGVVYGCVLLGVAGRVFGIDVTPLLATGSVTTVVVGLALQQPLSNLFSGVMLQVERSPTVGDWVLVDNREGQITAIGWRSTRIRTFADDIVVVPNAQIANLVMVNYSLPSVVTARLLPIPVPLDVEPRLVERMVADAAGGIEEILKDPAPKAWLVQIDDHCQRYVVKLYVKEFRRHDDLESDFLKAVWYRFKQEGVAFPGPRLTLGGGVTALAPAPAKG